MNIEFFLYEHPIFRLKEFEDWKGKQGTTNPLSIHSALRHYVKLGRIKRLRRELYGVIAPNDTVETAFFDSYLIAAKAAYDSVLAYHTALELHGVAYSSFEQFTFITSQKIKPFDVNDQRYQPVAIPKALRSEAFENFGVETIDRLGLKIKLTNLARTYVDVIDRPDLSGGWEEVCRSIRNIVVLNMKEVTEYCLALQNATLVAKIGFFLEQREGAFIAPESVIKTLLQYKPTSPQYMGDKEKEKHNYIKKWNLMVPLNVLKQSWDEPNYVV